MKTYQFMPSLQLDEYEALRESIRKYGVIQPVITDEDGNIIDGYHRVKICQDLGIAYPTRIMEGLTEEEKENLAVSLNIKRRHLTKEQKKTLAIELRELGWTQERIAGVMEVTQKTISNWFSNFSNPNQPSPTTRPDPELLRLQKELAARDEFERQQEQEAERLRKELKAAKNAPAPEPVIVERVVEKPVVSPELEKRVKQKEAKLDAAMKALEERTQREESADKVNRETMEEHYRLREADLTEEIARKVSEMDEAQKAGLDVSELQEQKGKLQIEILKLQGDLEAEARLKKIREQFRRAGNGVTQALTIIELAGNEILQHPAYCRLSPEEILIVLNDLAHLHDASGRVIVLLEQVMEKIKGGAGLHVVKGKML
jgi:ParB-like chromosome segregation protein Spo0J